MEKEKVKERNNFLMNTTKEKRKREMKNYLLEYYPVNICHVPTPMLSSIKIYGDLSGDSHHFFNGKKVKYRSAN